MTSIVKTKIMNTNPKVDEYLKKKEHPLTNEIQRVRTDHFTNG